MDIPKIEDLNSSNCTEKYFKAHYSEFHEKLRTDYPDLSWSECLYWYYNEIKEYPRCICGNKTNFINFKRGYREFCCKKCMNGAVQRRREQTCLERYGVANPMKNVEIKQKLQTSMRSLYGVDNIFQSDQIKQQIKESNRDKYGVDYPLQSNSYKNHYKEVMRDKYGIEWNSQLESVKESKKSHINETIKKSRETFKNNFLASHPNIIDYDDIYYTCRCTHEDCNKCVEKIFKIPKQIYHSRNPQSIELCTILKPINECNKNTSIEIFVKNILEKNNIEYSVSNRSIISPQEIDIYIPEKKLGIECNGIYWHSSIYKSDSYHYQKYEQCQIQGIQLLNIWEDWVINKPDIVESIILSKLGIYQDKIYARKCKIVNINHKEAFDFLSQNHIQGSCNASARYGLAYNGELISLMTFGKKRTMMMGSKTNHETWELLRFCTKLNTIVVGGASKLLSHFIKEFQPKTIESFSSHDISNGNVYKQLGFVESSNSVSSYWYVDKHMIRYHRFTFNKQSLIEQGYDASLTEEQIMTQRGFLKIYDSGQTKWVLKCTK